MKTSPRHRFAICAKCLFSRYFRQASLALLLLVSLAGTVSLEARPIRNVAILNAADRNDPGNEQAQLWQIHLRAFDLSTRLVTRNELRQGISGAELLIIPDVRTFSNEERDAILDFVARGNTLLLTGRSGSKTHESRDRSLAASLGLNFRDVSKDHEESWAVVMDAPSRITAGLPRMQRMNVQIPNPPTLTNGPAPNAFWLTSAVAKPDYGKAGEDAAIVEKSHGPGKIAWLGFNIDNIGGDLDSSEVFFQLTRNILRSFRNLPVIELAPWPYPYRKGVLYSMDVEERFGNMEPVNETPNLKAITYFILTFSAGLHQNLLRNIAEQSVLRTHSTTGMAAASSGKLRGEIAVHGDNHDVFRGQPPEFQRKRLQRTSDYILEVTGERPIGFRPPEEAYDFFTLQALVDTGFEYILGNNNPDRAQPRIIRVGDQRLVQMTILNKDDINLVTQAGSPAPEKVLAGYLYDIDQIFDRGGLYVVNLHSQILAVREYISVFRDVVTYTNSKNAWTVNAAEVYDWWLRREGLAVTVQERSNQRLLFTVTNQGSSSVQDAAVNVWLPENARSTLIESPAGGRRVLDFQTDRSQLKLRVPLLLPDDSVEFLVQWRE